MKNLQFRTSTNRSPLRISFILFALLLTCFGLSPTARAVLPPPDGGYPGNNTAEGDDALFSLTTGTDNTAVGFNALYNNTGYFNTAIGSQALLSNTTGLGNTAMGKLALYGNTTGTGNTACGDQALRDNTGDFNTAIGLAALSDNTTGFNNTATGAFALTTNTTGDSNTANGYAALDANTTGYSNTASGYAALSTNTTGTRNTANGYIALLSNTSGERNTANGAFALLFNATGNHNAAFGWSALYSNTTGNFNIALGDGAGDNLTTGDNNIDIGNEGVAGESSTIRIGTEGTQRATYIAGISGIALGSGVAVRVNSNGQLGTVASSARFKQNIKAMDKMSEAILALKPVTFRYKKELDPEGIPQFGLVAEDVEKVNPALVARDADGKVYTVRYEAVNAMLLNEFLKEHRTVQEQKATIAELKKNFAEQQKQIEALTTGLQKVSAQLAAASPSRGGLELSKPAPQMVGNNQ